MEKLYKLAKGANTRFPEGNEPFQITTRLLEECGEVAKEINHWEGSGIKRLKYGEPSRDKLANELRQAFVALAQLVVYYSVEEEIEASMNASINRMEEEGLFSDELELY